MTHSSVLTIKSWLNGENRVCKGMTTFHPLYDPIAGLWQAEDGTEAKSLSELKRSLPPGSRIKDYYPNGYGNVVRPRVVVKTEPWKEELPVLEPATFSKSKGVKSTKVFFPKVDWKALGPEFKRLFEAGASCVTIAVELGCSVNQVVGYAHRRGLSFSGREK